MPILSWIYVDGKEYSQIVPSASAELLKKSMEDRKDVKTVKLIGMVK